MHGWHAGTFSRAYIIGHYSPLSAYAVVLTGGASQYKGLLVQGRRGTNPVGSFAAGNLVQPACSAVSVNLSIDWLT